MRADHPSQETAGDDFNWQLPKRPRKAFLIPAIISAVLLLAFAGILWLDSSNGQRWVTNRLAGRVSKSGFSIKVGKISGSLFDSSQMEAVQLRDLDGTFAVIDAGDLIWQPAALLRRKIDISDLHIWSARWLRQPHFYPSDPHDPLLPKGDINIANLRVDRLVVEPGVSSRTFTLAAKGNAVLRDQALITNLDLTALDAPDRAFIKIHAAPDKDIFDIQARVDAPANGALAALLRWQPGLDLDISGKGSFANWHGNLNASIAAAPLANLALHATSGVIFAKGTLAANVTLPVLVQKIIMQTPNVSGSVSINRPNVQTSLTLVGAGMNISANATVDLEKSSLHNTAVKTSDADGHLLSIFEPGLLAKNVHATASLEGLLRNPDMNLQITANNFKQNKTEASKVSLNVAGKPLDHSEGQKPLNVTFKSAAITTGDVALARYLTDVNAKGQFLQSGGDITLSGLDVKSHLASMTGLINLNQNTGKLTAVVQQANLPLATGTFGDMPVVVRGTVKRDSRTAALISDITASATTKNWHAPAEVIRFLGDQPQLRGIIQLGQDGSLSSQKLALVGSSGDFTGSGSLRGNAISASLVGTIKNLKALAPDTPITTTKPLPVIFRIEGTIKQPRITADVSAPELNVAGFTASKVTAQLAPIDTQRWHVVLKGDSEFGPVNLAANARTGINPSFENITGRIGTAEVDGKSTLLAGKLWQADLSVVLKPTGDQSGALNIVAKLFPEQNRQAYNFNLTGKNLERTFRGKDISIDAATLIGSGFLGGEPTLKLQSNGSGIDIGNTHFDQISVAGGGSMRNASFNYTARGSNASPFDGHGIIVTRGSQTELLALSATLDGTLAHQPVQMANPLVLQKDRNAWQLRPTKINVATGSIIATGRKVGESVDAQLTLGETPLTFLDIVSPNLNLTGTATGNAHLVLAGSKLKAGDATIALKRVRRAGLFQSSQPLDINTVLALRDRGLTGTVSALVNRQPSGDARFTVARDRGGNLVSGALAGRLTYTGPADTLWGLTGLDAHDIRGPLALSTTLAGKLDNPYLDGTLRMTNGRYESIELGLIATSLSVDGRFKGSKLAISGASGKLSGGGSFTAGGNIDVSAAKNFPASINIALDHATVIKREDLELAVTGPLLASYDADGGKISGPLVINRMRVKAGQSGGESIPELQLRERNRSSRYGTAGANGNRAQPVIKYRIARPFELALNMTAPQKVFVEGLGLNSEWGGDLTVRGNAIKPSISGRLHLIRGTYDFAGRRFLVDRGTVNFQGQDTLNPVLSLSASSSVTNRATKDTLEALINIAGTAQLPQISFSSTPSLPQDEILSLILFGSSIETLSPLEAVQLASALAQVSQGGVRNFNILGKTKKLLRIDKFGIVAFDEKNSAGNATLGTAISGGKYVSDRVYVDVTTDGRGYTSTPLEVDLTKTLSILSKVNTLGGTNVAAK